MLIATKAKTAFEANVFQRGLSFWKLQLSDLRESWTDFLKMWAPTVLCWPPFPALNCQMCFLNLKRSWPAFKKLVNIHTLGPAKALELLSPKVGFESLSNGLQLKLLKFPAEMAWLQKSDERLHLSGVGKWSITLLFLVLASKVFQYLFFPLSNERKFSQDPTHQYSAPTSSLFWVKYLPGLQSAIKLDFLLLSLVLHWTMRATFFRNIRNCLPNMSQDTWQYLNGKMQKRSLWFL